MRDKRLGWFFLLTFAISWGIPGLCLLLSRLVEGIPFSLALYSPLYYVGVWGPALAALIVVGRTQGRAGLKAFGRRLLDWSFPLRWWLFALVGIPLLYFVGTWITLLLGEPEALVWYGGPWLPFLGTFLMRATAGPVEELGWRGFAQPVMQGRFHPWTVVLLLGLIHSLWHAPVFVVGRFTHFGTELPFLLAVGRFTAQIFVVTIFFHISFNATRGSLTLPFLMHWMFNGVYPWEGDADRLTGQTLAMGVAAAIMVAAGGWRWLLPENAATVVTPVESADFGGTLRPGQVRVDG